jgi:hypothetical protein
MPRIRSVVVVLAGVCTGASTLASYPHQLSYFNELAGGPQNGSKHLLGSNLDWGQDLIFAEEVLRLRKSPAVESVYFVGPNSRLVKYWSHLFTDEPNHDYIACSVNDLLTEYRTDQIPPGWSRIGYTVFYFEKGLSEPETK